MTLREVVSVALIMTAPRGRKCLQGLAYLGFVPPDLSSALRSGRPAIVGCQSGLAESRKPVAKLRKLGNSLLERATPFRSWLVSIGKAPRSGALPQDQRFAPALASILRSSRR